MSATAAPESAAVLLVLAWSETDPAVQALLGAEAGPAWARVLVVVPEAKPHDAPPAAEVAPVEPSFEPLRPTSPNEPLKPAGPSPALPESATANPDAPAAAEPAATRPPETAKAAAIFSASRPLEASAAPQSGFQPKEVVGLLGFSLSELAAAANTALPLPAWNGPALAPTAPYHGSDSQLPPGPAAAAGPANSPQTAPAGVALPGARAPRPPAGPASDPSAVRSLLHSETDGGEPEVSEAVALSAAHEPEEFFAAAGFAPERSSWPEALAALRPPQPAQTLAAGAAYAGGAAPDLNFQVIQFARFAVPLAQAQAPEAAVVYAPAWPAWLAAQELRQRTGRPLALHVREWPADAATAAGWQPELHRLALRRADLVLAETPELAGRLVRELGLPARAVRAVPAADAAGVARALHAAALGPATPAGEAAA